MPDTDTDAAAANVNVLTDAYSEFKYGHGKAITIIRSTSSLISIISSSLLILMIFRSQDGLTTTYHRLLLGLSISDITFSLGLVHFGAMSPIDLNYFLWNARGNQATCETVGFLAYVGSATGILYICSLNIFSLVTVKYNKSEGYIRNKVEPFLHGVPIAVALILGFTNLMRQNFNEYAAGFCNTAAYDPPHCMGYDDGQVPDGFEIPCGRGRDTATFAILVRVIFLFLPPIIVGTCLGMIYRFLYVQEKRVAKYGAGSLNPRAEQTPETAGAVSNDEWEDNQNMGFITSLTTTISFAMSIFGRKSSPARSNQEFSMSRTVLHRALAYSVAYFLTWMWAIVLSILRVSGMRVADPLAWPKWQLALWYLFVLFSPLQGFFNLLIFLHPKVMSAKRSHGENTPWCRAFAVAFWASATGVRVSRLVRQMTRKNSAMILSGAKSDDCVADSKSIPDNTTGGVGRLKSVKSIDMEEEKTEIQAHSHF